MATISTANIGIATRGLVLHTRGNDNSKPRDMVSASAIAGGVGGGVGGLLRMSSLLNV